MSNKFTSGPMKIGPGLWDDVYIFDEAGVIIGRAYVRVDHYDKIENRPAEANARLWAAAHLLLEACKLDNSFESDGPTLLEYAAYELEQHNLPTLANELKRKAGLERAAIAEAQGD